MWGTKIRTQPIDSSSPTLSTPSTIPSSTSPFSGRNTRALNETVKTASPLSLTIPSSIFSILKIVIRYPYLIEQVPSRALSLVRVLVTYEGVEIRAQGVWRDDDVALDFNKEEHALLMGKLFFKLSFTNCFSENCS